MNEPSDPPALPPRPLSPPPDPHAPAGARPVPGPQSLDSDGPPQPPTPPAPSGGNGNAGGWDMTWSGATESLAQTSPSLLVARYDPARAGAGAAAGAEAPGARRGPRGPGAGRLSTPALVAWISGAVVVAAAVVVALVLYLGSRGGGLSMSNGDAASLLPTRVDGFGVEVEKEPGFAEDLANASDGAALVVEQKSGSGRAFVAAVVLDGTEGASEDGFRNDFEQGLRAGDDSIGEFTDVTLDAVPLRTADLSEGGEYSKVYWWRPFRDAVLVVFASDESAGRKVLEALVEHNTRPPASLE